mgnify:CR=1 FL=1
MKKYLFVNFSPSRGKIREREKMGTWIYKGTHNAYLILNNSGWLPISKADNPWHLYWKVYHTCTLVDKKKEHKVPIIMKNKDWFQKKYFFLLKKIPPPPQKYGH